MERCILLSSLKPTLPVTSSQVRHTTLRSNARLDQQPASNLEMSSGCFEGPASAAMLSEGAAIPRQLPLLTDPATILSGELLAQASGEGVTPRKVTLAAQYKLDSNDGVLLPGLVTAAQSSRGQAHRQLHKPLIKQQVCWSEAWVQGCSPTKNSTCKVCHVPEALLYTLSNPCATVYLPGVPECPFACLV